MYRILETLISAAFYVLVGNMIEVSRGISSTTYRAVGELAAEEEVGGHLTFTLHQHGPPTREVILRLEGAVNALRNLHQKTTGN